MVHVVIEVPVQHKELARALKATAGSVVALGERGGDGNAVD
jgi:hypothetical protein